MENTIELLSRALEKQTVSQWARTFNIGPSAITNARARGRLSPVLAGNFAIKLGESPEHWIAIAALEAEAETPLLTTLKLSFKECRYSLFVPWRARCALTTHRAPRRFFYVCNWLR